jgi:hypothetical protein
MAFSMDGWNPIGGQSKKGTAPQMFAYTTTDTQATVRAAGYFNDVAATIAVGDILFVNASTGGTMTQSIHTVVSNTGTVVDVSDGTTISQTDTD